MIGVIKVGFTSDVEIIRTRRTMFNEHLLLSSLNSNLYNIYYTGRHRHKHKKNKFITILVRKTLFFCSL